MHFSNVTGILDGYLLLTGINDKLPVNFFSDDAYRQHGHAVNNYRAGFNSFVCTINQHTRITYGKYHTADKVSCLIIRFQPRCFVGKSFKFLLKDWIIDMVAAFGITFQISKMNLR
jgi:hypothetical protein